MLNKKQIIYSSLPFVLALLLFTSGGQTNAASAILFLTPATGTYAVGSSFSVNLKVDSAGQLINAADGILTFDTTKLEATSLSRSGSIFSLWVQEPVFSNTAGTISFAGGKPSIGYAGASGHIFTITFRAKAAGQAAVSFSSGSVLADDGMGTNVLGSMSSGSYTLTDKEQLPPPPPTQVPSAPTVSSPTHPDPEKWYSHNDPKFVWQISSDITGVRYLATRKPTSFPSFFSEPITETQIDDLSDDIWYFHIRLRNRFGWGNIAHFKFQIDTVPPAPFEITVKEGPETTNPQPTLVFTTTDELSGIDYFEIKIDTKDPIKVKEPEYKLPSQDLGKHVIVIKAVDRAGNNVLAMTEINILSIEPPVITEYPKELIAGSPLLIKGTSIPEALINVYLQRKEIVQTGQTKSDKEGNWLYIHEKPLERGTYQVYAEAIGKEGTKSDFSEEVIISVTPPAFIRIGKIIIDYLVVLLILLALIALIIFLFLWLLSEIQSRRKRLRKETVESKQSLKDAFEILKSETEKQIGMLDREPGLSKREQEIHDNLKRTLETSEQIIEKEIKDIEEELK